MNKKRKVTRVRIPAAKESNLLIRSSSFGYVVENFKGECVKGPMKGKVFPIMTRNGKPAIFPDMDSVPPLWRPFARKASSSELSRGHMMDRIVTYETETEMQGYKGLPKLRSS